MTAKKNSPVPASPEQLAALDAELYAHGLTPSDPKHPLKERPPEALRNALERASFSHATTAELKWRLHYLSGVSTRRAGDWLKDSRVMTRNAVAATLDGLCEEIMQEYSIDAEACADEFERAGRPGEEELGEDALEEFAREQTRAPSRREAFELLFYGEAEIDRQMSLNLELLHSVLNLGEEQKRALLGVVDAFRAPRGADEHPGWALRIEGPNEADNARELAARISLEARNLSYWAKERYPEGRASDFYGEE